MLQPFVEEVKNRTELIDKCKLLWINNTIYVKIINSSNINEYVNNFPVKPKKIWDIQMNKVFFEFVEIKDFKKVWEHCKYFVKEKNDNMNYLFLIENKDTLHCNEKDIFDEIKRKGFLYNTSVMYS